MFCGFGEVGRKACCLVGRLVGWYLVASFGAQSSRWIGGSCFCPALPASRLQARLECMGSAKRTKEHSAQLINPQPNGGFHPFLQRGGGGVKRKPCRKSEFRGPGGGGGVLRHTSMECPYSPGALRLVRAANCIDSSSKCWNNWKQKGKRWSLLSP